MFQQTTSQARVIDPVLTEIAQGYKNADMVGMALFPQVPVAQRGGKIVSFGKEDFALYTTQRAPGSNTRRIQIGYSSGSYALESHSLEGQVPYELQQDASQVAQVDLQAAAVRKVQNIIALRLEHQQAGVATTAGSYAASNKTTLSGTAQWSDYTGTSSPSKDIETGKEAVRSQIGRYPNTVVLSASVMGKVRQHPAIIDRIKYTGRDIVTPELLATLWGVDRVLVGGAVYTDATGAFVDVWGKFVVLAYTTIGTIPDLGEPTYGYTYRLGGYPVVETPYDDRSAKSTVIPVTDEVVPVLTSASAGYLISAAIA